MLGKSFIDFVSPQDRTVVLNFRERLQPSMSGGFEAGQCFDALAPALRAHIGVTLFDELAGRMAELDFKEASVLLEPYGIREKTLPS